MQSTIGGRLKTRRISQYSFFCPKSDGGKDATATSPIIFALRSASSKYILTMRPTFGWLLCPPIQQKPSKSEAPLPSQFYFFRPTSRRLKGHVNVLSQAFRPAAFPLKRSLSRRHHLRFGCCVGQSSSGHSRPVLRPSPIFSMGAILVPQTRGPNAARASPEAGCLLRLMGSRGAAIRVHGGCCHGEGGQSRWEVG